MSLGIKYIAKNLRTAAASVEKLSPTRVIRITHSMSPTALANHLRDIADALEASR